jgi:hypothetical protein
MVRGRAKALPRPLWNDFEVTPPLAAVPDLERELDGLYALPLDEFTKARNDLASRLKRAHQAEAAAAIRSLRKPATVAWAANQLARNEPKLVAALLETGERLRETQQRAVAGEACADELADATNAERAAIRSLLSSARDALGGRGTASVLDRLGQTLRAAAVDDLGRQLLERGRLTEQLTAVGFGPLEAVKPTRRRGDEIARAARDRVTALRATARTLAAQAREADEAAREAESAAEILREEATHRRADADRAAEELAEAEQALKARR